MVSTSQKKSLHSLMAANLSKLTIPCSSSSPPPNNEQDFDFNHVFGHHHDEPSAAMSPHAPFTHTNKKKLQEKIIKEKVKLPPTVSTEAHSLLKGN
ncbi:hypothetical protein Ahy_B01g057091 [Arachis hypogaea]|uniref:Uncharacterized protein n=1 Tax=Arachis hypogaea TaxID=3818 RepID=A0A445B0A3_ARAHY|nr:hypothetical protein Ahy_B01g057091 [Arachis hypogaea]